MDSGSRSYRVGAYGSDASVDTCHGHGAVGACGVLLVGGVAARATPTVSGTFLCIYIKMDGIANAIWSCIAGNARKDAAVSLSRAAVGNLLKSNIGGSALVPFSNHHDIILTNLSGTRYVTIFRRS